MVFLCPKYDKNCFLWDYILLLLEYGIKNRKEKEDELFNIKKLIIFKYIQYTNFQLPKMNLHSNMVIFKFPPHTLLKSC